MEIYIAMYDEPQRNSVIFGAFSTEGKARAACQEAEDEDAAEAGGVRGPLQWADDMAIVATGMYFARLVTLDESVRA